MQPVSSQAEVGQVVPLIGGTPRQWAVVTANQIVEAAVAATPDAATRAPSLGQRVASALMAPFMKMRAPQTPESIAALAESTVVGISDAVQTPPWSLDITEPTLRQAIKDKIIQNLTSASAP